MKTIPANKINDPIERKKIYQKVKSMLDEALATERELEAKGAVGKLKRVRSEIDILENDVRRLEGFDPDLKEDEDDE